MAEGYRRRGFLGRVGGAARTTGPSVLRTRTENNHIAPVNRCPGSALMPSHLLCVEKKHKKNDQPANTIPCYTGAVNLNPCLSSHLKALFCFDC